MEKINVFIDKEKINRLYDEEKYRNCMDKKYFEYIVSTGKEDYIDQYLNISKHKKIILFIDITFLLIIFHQI